MSTPTIDSRLVYPDSFPEIAEDLNRIMDYIDAIDAIMEANALYKVVFDSDGGSDVATQFVVSGDKVVEPTDPTKDDYTFKGWYIGEDEWDFDTEVSEHMTLTAVWEADE